MAQNTSPVAPVGELVHIAVDTAVDTTEAGAKALAASAIAMLQLVRNVVDSGQSLAKMGVDLSADTVDEAMAKLQAFIRTTAGT